jgi:hypothetical protein
MVVEGAGRGAHLVLNVRIGENLAPPLEVKGEVRAEIFVLFPSGSAARVVNMLFLWKLKEGVNEPEIFSQVT